MTFSAYKKLAWLIDQYARAGSGRGSELNSARAPTLTCNSTAISFVFIRVYITSSLHVETNPFLSKQHISVPVSKC